MNTSTPTDITESAALLLQERIILRTSINERISLFRLTNDSLYQLYLRRLIVSGERRDNEFVKAVKERFNKIGKVLCNVFDSTICCLFVNRNRRAPHTKRPNVLKTVRIQ